MNRAIRHAASVVWRLLAVGVVLLASSPGHSSGDVLLEDGGFDKATAGQPPAGWGPKLRKSKASLVVSAPGAFGTAQGVKVATSEGRVTPAFRARFAGSVDDLWLDLCFAFSDAPGEVLTLQTHSRTGKRASQIRVAVTDGKLVYYDGEREAWVKITDQIEATTDPAKPRWHRLEVIAHRNEPEIRFWVSAPGSKRLPQAPTAKGTAHKSTVPFGAIGLAPGSSPAGSYFFVDEIKAQDAAGAPPPGIRRLLETGKVTMYYYDPAKERHGKGSRGGLTKFWINPFYRFKWRYKYSRTKEGTVAWVKPAMTSLHVKLRHKIYVPQSLDRTGRWRFTLMRHEFDHVAISTDPRIARLIDHLCRKIGWAKHVLGEKDKLGAALYKRVSRAEIEKRRKAVNTLVQRNYSLLDTVTGYGRRPIKDREAFFMRLFTRDNLKEMKFPYIEDAISLVESEEYLAIRPYFGD